MSWVRERSTVKELQPFRPQTLRWKNEEFILRHEMACSINKEGHLIVLEYEALGIRAYAATRDQAIKDLSEEFAFLWQQYAQESEVRLSCDGARFEERALSPYQGGQDGMKLREGKGGFSLEP